MLMAWEPKESPEDRIKKKHDEYYRLARRFRFLYYSTRLAAGLSAGVLPFVISSMPGVATVLSIVVVVITVVDTVFSPKERWKTYSRATDLLYVAQLKKAGKFDEFEEALKIILTTEEQQTFQLLGLDEVIETARKAGDAHPKKT